MSSAQALKEKFIPYHTFEAKNGMPINIRPLQPDDTQYLIDIFDNMSSRSRYHRYNQSLDHVSDKRKWDVAEMIANADPETNFGLLAFADLPHEPDPPIGGARYVKINPTEAEIAISVIDSYQGMGIGSFLLQQLTEYAVRDGVQKFVAGIQNNNEPIWIILNKLPYHVERRVDGNESNVEVDLTRPRN